MQILSMFLILFVLVVKMATHEVTHVRIVFDLLSLLSVNVLSSSGFIILAK
jgi:hypothetical protein